MKMIKAADGFSIFDYPKVIYNCNVGKCKRPYVVPLPLFSDLQLYINFGDKKPISIQFSVFNRCSRGSTSLNAECFLIANNGSYWYGVFTKFLPIIDYPVFVVAAECNYEDETTGIFYSQEYSIAEPCANLSKLSVCYPDNYNAEDINGIYVGEINNAENFIGNSTLRYQHKFWVRDAEIIEISNKITFVSNAKKNFGSTLNKIFELRAELVPGWYKDYLVSVYFRGNFLFNETPTKASELSCENILEEADLWKPYVKIDKEIKGFFGCALITCQEPCTNNNTLCELNQEDVHIENITTTGFDVHVTGLMSVENEDECYDSWDINIRTKGGQLIAEETGLSLEDIYHFTTGQPNTEYDVQIIKHCCISGLTEFATIPTQTPEEEAVNITGTLSYVCVDSPSESGYVSLTFNFDAPLPVDLLFYIGSIVSWPPQKHGQFLNGFTVMPGVTFIGNQNPRIKLMPAGTTSLIVSGVDIQSTSPGSTGWTCNDDSGYYTTDIYIKIATPGYNCTLISGTSGITIHNQ